MIAIYDNHQQIHGQVVLNSFREYSQLPINLIENGGGELNESKMLAAMAGNYKVFNCSFNSSPTTLTHVTQGPWAAGYNACKDAYNRGCTVVFGAGNVSPALGQEYTGTAGAHPYSLDAGAAEFKDGRLVVSDYSTYSGLLTEYYLDGSQNGLTGTSFAAPKLSAIVAEIQNRHGWQLSQMELRSVLTQNCTFFEYKGVWLRFVDWTAIANAPVGVTNKLRIQALYRIFLQRHPDAGGYAYWLGQLNAGKSIAEIAVPFKNSTEYRSGKAPKCPIIEMIQSWYHLWLGREADDGGAGYWAQRYIDGADYVALAREFIAGARANGEQIDERLLF